MDAMRAAELLKRIDLFQGLTRDDIIKIFSKGMTMYVPKGQAIFMKGTVGSQMYVVLGGKIGVYDKKKCIAELTAGDMFGEMALVNKEPRSADVGALEDSEVFTLSESVFQNLLSKRVAIQILLNIIRTLSHRLKDANLRFTGS